MPIEQVSPDFVQPEEATPATGKVLEEAIKSARNFLLGRQNEKGYWVGELEADASVAAGYIPLMYFMQGAVDPIKQSKVVNYVKSKQNEDGSWSAFYGGPGDLNVTVQVYFALKLAGQPADSVAMQKTRDWVLAHGGLMQTNTITRVWLSLFGQFEYRGVPSIPPEVTYLPTWFYLNIYEFASWSRETIMALILILHTRPQCAVPGFTGIAELYLEAAEKRNFNPGRRDGLFGWKNIFLTADRLFKAVEKLHLETLRRPALRQVEKWVVEHQEADGSWGGILLPWIYSLMALKSLGYPADHPVIHKGLAGLAPFLIEDSRFLRMQPALSPVWDTAWSTLALIQSGLPPDHTAAVKAGRWLLGQEIRQRGDWRFKNPNTEPGGWAFEFNNTFYPDMDDSAVVGQALLCLRLNAGEEPAKLTAVGRGYDWVREMQSRDGGWAAFDRDNNKSLLASLPYGEFMTPIDPTSADVTAHAVELIAILNHNSVALKKAILYLKKNQESDGSWYGRWGVNYIYGTGLTLAALKAAGESASQKYIYQAADWLQNQQNSDGGWGESCLTYTNPGLKGQGVSAPSQTAWALMGLMAAGRGSGRPAQKGISFLLRSQNADGSWDEESYTGTGFPRAFYLRYDLYRIYFPLLVLGQYKTFLEEKNG